MAERKEHKASVLLASAAQNASYNMVLQLMLRLMTFGLNAFVLRYISKDMLGVVNVRLTLLYSTILFLATEAFDKACLSSKVEKQTWPKVINLMWCTLPVSIVCSAILGFLWLNVLDQPDPDIVPYYGYGVVCFAVSTVIMVCARPLLVVAAICMFVKLKVLANGIAELSKCLLTILLVIYWPELGLLNFALAQLVYSLVNAAVFYVYFLWCLVRQQHSTFPFTSARQFFPQAVPDQHFIDKQQASLTVSIFKQSFLKQLLTEGEKYVMTVFAVVSFADQGIYDVVSNLGSMAARFVFQPIEESGYLFFSQLLLRGEPVEKQKQESIALAADVLHYLLKMVVLLGVIILVFGYSYAYLALDLYGGTLLSSGTGPLLLRWFCLYVLVIAVNGVTECFVFATMSKQQVDRYNHFMVAFSVMFLLAALGLTQQFGSVGFILANCFNMAARIAHSIYYIRKYFWHSPYKPLQGVVPAVSVVVVLVSSFIVTVLSEGMFCCGLGVVYRLLHIAVGGTCLLAVLLSIYLSEPDLLTFVKQQFFKSKHKKDE